MKKEDIFAYMATIGRREKIQFFLTYVYALALGSVALFIALVLYFFIGEIPPLLFFFPAVALSSWYGGWKPGIITTLVGVSGIYYFFSKPSLLLLLALFFCCGAIISFIIDVCKKTDEISRYKRREKEYGQLLIYLQKENEKARIELKARDEFLSIASHELKTPLTSMVLQLQTVLHSISNVSLAHFSVENLLKMLKSAEQQSRRLTKMINDLLNVSLITTGRLELELESVDLTAITKEVIDHFSERLQKENYSLKFHGEKPVVGQWDKLRIEQIITNLISNAIKYGQGKPIEVSTSKEGSLAKLMVKDRGIGISKEHHARVFGRFERAVSTAEYKGLGIGLYITHQIVKAHGGRVKVESKLGKGSTFTVELPLGKS